MGAGKSVSKIWICHQLLFFLYFIKYITFIGEGGPFNTPAKDPSFAFVNVVILVQRIIYYISNIAMKIKGFLHLEIYYAEIYNINKLFLELRKQGWVEAEYYNK